ncbi:MAG: RAMP superfamily CRISPR-associated protein [Planctomycetota bacterium]|jgi:CRISPR/Cas system CSM-associated protein Csm3 (group 7 of RAMP superfamily)|nr:RAMP superfamily CRISPR-associated protein [Planctomycetota bacterium]
MPENTIHCLLVPLRFPAGLAPGEDRTNNTLRLSRDGARVPVLRGSAIAGVLRHAWKKRFGNSENPLQESFWFGFAADNDTVGTPSRLLVPDCPFAGAKEKVIVRTHNLLDRFSGAPVDGGLFSLEAFPPGTAADLLLWLDCRPDRDRNPIPYDPEKFLRQLAACFRGGLTFGGNGARGIGLAELRGGIMVKGYDIGIVEQHAAWLDDRRNALLGKAIPDMRELGAVPAGSNRDLVVEVELGVARGQDFLVSDGQGLKYQLEPQQVGDMDGEKYWRLPGSSLRGLFRAWMTRLAAREGEPVANSAALERKRREAGKGLKTEEAMNGDNLGWGFIPKGERTAAARDRPESACPIMKLFGSFRRAGRIHFADAIVKRGAANAKTAEQMRMHVAIDRITGGANDGMLFDNLVLTSDLGNAFPVRIRIADPEEKEARWLAQTLKALDLGILRVGSSKASGRLTARKVRASGGHAEVFGRFSFGEER